MILTREQYLFYFSNMSGRNTARGGGKTATSGVRAIANVLGINRQEVSQYTNQVRNEPMPLYPPLAKEPLPLEETKELVFMIDTKQEFLHRFRESPFHHKRTGKRDVRRYTDKYKLMDKEPFEPHWERLPAELNWTSKKKANKKESIQRKIAKLDENALLEKLGQSETMAANKEEAEEDKTTRDDEEEDDDGSPSRTRPPQNEDDEAVDYSDEDYLAEGANDYVDTYFDGGDEYEEDGDALGDEGAY